MNKFLDSSKCIYEPIKYSKIKEGQIFTLEKNSIFGYINTGKSKKVETFHGGRWSCGPMATLVWDDNAEYIPSEYDVVGLSKRLWSDEGQSLSLKENVYLVKNPKYLSNIKYMTGSSLNGDDSYMLELARNQLKNDYGVDIGEVPRNQQTTLFIRRDNGIYQCKECGNNVGRNFNYCPWCGRHGFVGWGGNY